MYQKHCPGCFENKQGLPRCPACGYDESLPRPAVFLPYGTILGGSFRIGRVLGAPGGYGITYLAWDVHLQQRVAIKEYLPRDLAARAAASADIQPTGPPQRAEFEQGLNLFLSEARLLARFEHPNVVRVRTFFRAHGTAYLVMDYYAGVSLGDYLHETPRLPAETAISLLDPVLDGLEYVHQRGVLHRDVKPRNVYLAQGGRTILLDFGAARQLTGGEAGAVMLSEGFAPLEQYQKNAEQGPWTDVYGAAATLYRMIAGSAPPPPLDRLGRDTLDLSPFPPALAAVMHKALAVQGPARYPGIAAFRADLWNALAQAGVAPAPMPAVRVPATIAADAPTVTVEPVTAAPSAVAPPRRVLMSWPQVLVLSGAVLLAAVLLAFAR